jgi:hypothetical protein
VSNYYTIFKLIRSEVGRDVREWRPHLEMRERGMGTRKYAGHRMREAQRLCVVGCEHLWTGACSHGGMQFRIRGFLRIVLAPLHATTGRKIGRVEQSP